MAERQGGHNELEPPPDEFFRLMVASVVDYAMFLLDTSGNVTSWNIGAERIKGYQPHEVIGRHFSLFYPAEDVQAGKCEMELEYAARDGRFEDEGWRIRGDDSRFWANVIITALRDPSGKLIGFAKITRDLTERKRLERERCLRLGQEPRAANLRSVLLVDDHDDVRMLLAEALRHHGYEVQTALDGHEALALVQAFAPDVGVFDIESLGIDAYELAVKTRQARPSRPIHLIAVSGSGRANHPLRWPAGFDGHLMKPVGTRELLEAIASLEL